jgi:hypothetical protein
MQKLYYMLVRKLWHRIKRGENQAAYLFSSRRQTAGQKPGIKVRR